MTSRRFFAFALAALLAPPAARAQASRSAPAGPALSASRVVMAGSMLNVLAGDAPAGARLAIARPADPATSAIVVVSLGGRSSASLPTPGAAGDYELRLTVDRGGAPIILLRQPLATTPASATLAAPARIGRGKSFPVRGIGPNGEQDRVTLVAKDAPDDAVGPSFFPTENVEATLDAPNQAGAYELRYVMNAPVSGVMILARRLLKVE